LGINTKPDTLDAGGEGEQSYVDLARNKIVELLLGWHVVKNRDFTCVTAQTRKETKAERKFFSERVWASLPDANVGIDALRTKLGQFFYGKFVRELPSLQDDLKPQFRKAERSATSLGTLVSAKMICKLYLTSISQQISRLLPGLLLRAHTAILSLSFQTHMGTQDDSVR